MARSETWYTSDLHIGHRLISEKRGFQEVQDHNLELATRWDSIVSPADKVWILGDISGGSERGERLALEWLRERPGTKHLVSGNHDSVHPMHSKAHLRIQVFLDVFASVQQSAYRRLAGEAIVLSHFPYLESSHPDDTHGGFEQWRLPFCGTWLLHGHIHSKTRQHGRNIHVGLDAWDLAPVSIDVVAQMMRVNARSTDAG